MRRTHSAFLVNPSTSIFTTSQKNCISPNFVSAILLRIKFSIRPKQIIFL